jgi:hypothetical protein
MLTPPGQKAGVVLSIHPAGASLNFSAAPTGTHWVAPDKIEDIAVHI